MSNCDWLGVSAWSNNRGAVIFTTLTGKNAHPTCVDTSLTIQATGCCCLAAAAGVEKPLKFLLHLLRSFGFAVTQIVLFGWI